MADSTNKKRRKQSEPRPRRKSPVTAVFLDSESPPTISTAEIEVIRDQKIMPIIAGIQASNPSDRAQHLVAATSIVEDAQCRKLLLREHIVRVVIEQSLLDSAQEVVVAAWALFDRLVEREGHDVAVHLFRKGILKLVDGAIDNLDSTVDKIQAGSRAVPLGIQKLAWDCTNSIISLLTNLSEATLELLEAISTPKVLAFASKLLNPTTPDRVGIATSVFLDRVTDSNALAFTILSMDSGCIAQLQRIVFGQDKVALLQAVAACGALNNLLIQAPADSDFTYKHCVSPGQLAEYLGAVFDTGLANSASRDTKQAKYTALDTLADIANHIRETFGQHSDAVDDVNGVHDNMDEDAGSDDAMEDDDGASDPDDEEEEEAHDSDSDSELPDELGADLDMITGDEGTAARASNRKPRPCPELNFIVNDIDMIVRLVRSSPSDEPARRIRHASITLLSAVAHAFATITANRSRKLKFTFTEELLDNYSIQSTLIWDMVITPVLLSNSADIYLAEKITTLAMHITAFAPSVSIAKGQHHSFLALYNAAAAPIPLKAACVRVLANLAQCQGADRIPANREIGTFLISTVNKLPYLGDPVPDEVYPEVVVACLDAIYDVYADKEFDYDEEVFVQLGFLRYLRSFVGRVKGMIKRIDKRKNPELRESAEEALLNLNAFIKYKTQERQ
ncbi:hypothetical protein ABW21_db0207681 [Orbilia brochopaga]|nr:hypothetical protein ABW21_db0207681 [Drechslerella brochopaga]